MNTLIGKSIKEIRTLTPDEMSAEYWSGRSENTIVLVLDDGTLLYPSRDPEGNGPGVLFGKLPTGAMFGLHTPAN